MQESTSMLSWADDIDDDDRGVKKASFDDIINDRSTHVVTRHVAFHPGNVKTNDLHIPHKMDMNVVSRQQISRIALRPLSLLACTFISMASWEYLLLANLPALENGGRAGLFWSFIWTTSGWALISTSLAEMASTGLYNGGRYHLSLNCALPKRRQLFNYASGWLSFVSCQASAASSLFLAGRLKQPFIALYVPDFTAQGWQSMLLVYPGIAIMMLFNIHGARLIPILQNIGTTFHVLGLIAIAALLWTLGPHVTAGKALLTFTETGGWSPTGLALMIGQITGSVSYLGIVAPTHLSASLQTPNKEIPQAIRTAFWTNATLGLVLVSTLVFSLPDIRASLPDPFLYIFRLTLPTGGIVAITTILLLLATIHVLASTSICVQQITSFTKLPPSPRQDSDTAASAASPLRATLLTATLTACLALLYLVPNIPAFETVLSLATSAHLLSHSFSISAHLYRQLCEPSARLTRRKKSILINVAAVVYALQAAFWALWPSRRGEMNWAGVILAGLVLVAAGCWWMTREFSNTRIEEGEWTEEED